MKKLAGHQVEFAKLVILRSHGWILVGELNVSFSSEISQSIVVSCQIYQCIFKAYQFTEVSIVVAQYTIVPSTTVLMMVI